MSSEVWRAVPGFPHYDVSDLGNVRSWRGNGHARAKQPKPMRPRPDRGGYLRLVITNEAHERANVSVHGLVLLAFVGPRPEELETRHLNGDQTDNRLVNLKYGTKSENQRDKLLHGTHHFGSRTHCSRGHEYTPENTWLRSGQYQRVCRTCKRMRDRQSATKARSAA